jgi:hypothetical protein
VIINKVSAIQSLKPTASWTMYEDTVTWLDSEQTEPTDAEIATEITRLQGVYDGLAYARARKVKYDLLNQDEMRYDDVKNTTTTWVDAIDAIKAAHPKP